MISTSKLALIHVAKKWLEEQRLIDEDNYRDLLRAEGGVSSSRDLSDDGFDRLMKRFERLGFVSTMRETKRAKRNRPANVVGIVTPDQLRKIASNYEALGFDTVARRQGFNRRQCRKAEPQTVSDGMKIIDGQEAILKRSRDAAAVVNTPVILE